MKYKLLNPCTTADTVPADFKPNNCMLRAGMWKRKLEAQAVEAVIF